MAIEDLAKMPAVSVDAGEFAAAWSMVAVAAEKEAHVQLEVHPEGVRLIATDGALLLRSWVVKTGRDSLLDVPGDDEAPDVVLVIHDEKKRVHALMKHEAKLAKDDPGRQLTFYVGTVAKPGDQLMLAGMEKPGVVFATETERVAGVLSESSGLTWRAAYQDRAVDEVCVTGFSAHARRWRRSLRRAWDVHRLVGPRREPSRADAVFAVGASPVDAPI